MIDDGVVNKVINLIDVSVMETIGTEELADMLSHHFRLVTLLDLLVLTPMTELQAARMADRFARHVGFLRARELASNDLVSPTICDLCARMESTVERVQARHDPELGGGSAFMILCFSIRDRYTTLLIASSPGLRQMDLVCEPLVTHVEILKDTSGPTQVIADQYNWVRIKQAELQLSHPHVRELREMLHEIELDLVDKFNRLSG